jgi:hypothetical protein
LRIGRAFAVFSIIAYAGAVTINDDCGNLAVFAAPAQRIVALAPSLTEFVFAAGEPARRWRVLQRLSTSGEKHSFGRRCIARISARVCRCRWCT